MKFMKLGTRPDTFYTEEATRSVSSDVPSDLIIQIKNTKYLLHKFPLVPKCGLLQQLCSQRPADCTEISVALDEIPGGEEAFELCAKFCYGITINLSAYNFVPAFCAAKFLRMSESVEKGNFVQKLEAFFGTCILEGWKDSVVTLESTTKLIEWSENLGIIRQCINSIVEKILTPPSKVTWSFTYTRPGYSLKRQHSVPKDWWTEDISILGIDLFRCIITAVRSTNVLPPPLIGEALHVYACRWLPDATKKNRPAESSASQTEDDVRKHRQVLETIATMIPTHRGSLSIGFTLRLLSLANFLAASQSTKSELVRRAGLQLDEATVEAMLIPSSSFSDQCFYDIDLVRAVVESFLMQWRRNNESLTSLRKVTKLVDAYLQVVARDGNMPVSKIVSLAESLPDIARLDHDDIYKAINIYLKEHPEISKAEKKQLCQMLDCRKLSQEVCAHAVRNERLPLRTVVQVLFFDQERHGRSKNSVSRATRDGGASSELGRLLEAERKYGRSEGAGEVEIKEEEPSVSKLESNKAMRRRQNSKHGSSKG
ncbi:hypothetical protein Scep_029015 [Stephania cephalantha]|uniref:NPH3 domain-containing protein n=1 Tax=Stephania cephalantha TaxID=152367 RepID=A0AAP0EI96_9MAGN